MAHMAAAIVAMVNIPAKRGNVCQTFNGKN
jgi:hypothetical protein